MVDEKPNLTPAERALLARTRHAFTRLGGLEFGDKLTDGLVDHYSERKWRLYTLQTQGAVI